MVSSADMVNGISMSSTTFNWSAGAIFLFWHRFAESELGMASPCFIKGGHFMPFFLFLFFSLSVSVSVSVSHSFLSNKRRVGLSLFREESPSEAGYVILTLPSKRR